MENSQTRRIEPGDSLIKFSDAARQRFGHSSRWLWNKIKTEGFPRPIRLDGQPHFISREIDLYLERVASGKSEKVAA